MKPIPKQIIKLSGRAQALREGTETYFSITCPTGLKSLCRDPQVAARFVLYLVERTQEKMSGGVLSEYIDEANWAHYEVLIAKVIDAMKSYLEAPDAVDGDHRDRTSALRDILSQVIKVQNEYKRQKWGPVRLIRSWDLLVVEKALRCFVSPDDASCWAYHAARRYAERYNPHFGTGLIPASAPLLEDIVQFWHSGQIYRD
ncbi:MAG: hypothetical protein GY832_25370 [Chloroflexi bacterium]|nr:hypothetical protein [Chloroflexota bacterium]